MVAQFKSFTSAQTGLSVPSGGGGNFLIVDALLGSAAAPTLVGSAVAISGSGGNANFTIPSAAAGDIIVIMADQAIGGIGQVGTPPAATQVVGVSPIIVVQNCICANYNPSATGGNNLVWVAPGGTPPSANVTQTTNLYASPWNGSTFGSPSFGTVFADSNQAHYNYALAGGSPALNAASNPGTSPYGQSLIPAYQSSYTGTVTPGTPIPAKTPRSDIGPALTGAIGALKGS
jgi:hypothetical protein